MEELLRVERQREEQRRARVAAGGESVSDIVTDTHSSIFLVSQGWSFSLSPLSFSSITAFPCFCGLLSVINEVQYCSKYRVGEGEKMKMTGLWSLKRVRGRRRSVSRVWFGGGRRDGFGEGGGRRLGCLILSFFLTSGGIKVFLHGQAMVDLHRRSAALPPFSFSVPFPY